MSKLAWIVILAMLPVAAVAQLDLTIEPSTGEVPAEGGIIYYDVTIINNTDQAIAAIGAQMVWLPGGQFHWLGRTQLLLQPGTTFVENLALEVPANAPAGWYEYTGIVIIPGTPWWMESSSWDFEKLEPQVPDETPTGLGITAESW